MTAAGTGEGTTMVGSVRTAPPCGDSFGLLGMEEGGAADAVT